MCEGWWGASASRYALNNVYDTVDSIHLLVKKKRERFGTKMILQHQSTSVPEEARENAAGIFTLLLLLFFVLFWGAVLLFCFVFHLLSQLHALSGRRVVYS